ncbi:MAG: peroxiredoxin [Pseudomonadota bacterium]|nr:peroxiredoxin [Pseudomonadota bacterium]
MKINENEIFPEVVFFKVTDSGPNSFKSSELFGNKKVILVAVPGAFTPTCSEDHLPGYIKFNKDFMKKGVDKIFFVSNNDAFVMKSWGDLHGAKDIDFISDSNGELREKTGLVIDLSNIGLGERLSRFVIVIEDGIIKKIFAEDGASLKLSKAENVLNAI